MNPDTERIELPGGEWWDIKTYLTRGDRKKVNRLERTWIKTREDVTPEEREKDPKSALEFDAANADLDARDDLLLELGTVAWSYEVPFSMAAVDGLEDDVVDIVLKRMAELYLRKEAELAESLKKG